MKKQGYKTMTQGDYWNLHQWLRRKYGSAFLCENNCGESRKGYFEYALIHGKKYERNRENFKMLCKKCHYIYDDLKTIGPKHPMWGRHHTEDTRKKMRLSSRHLKPNLGNKASKETRLKMSLSRKGVKFSEEHKKNISLALKKYVLSKTLNGKVDKIISKDNQ